MLPCAPSHRNSPPRFSAAERERHRELASYFSAASVPLKDQQSGALPVAPKLSKDATLTALAQLATLRLDCDRAFVSLIDGRNQYIIAEATRSHSLYHAGSCVNGDEIFLGVQTLDISYGVCPTTIEVFTDNTGSLGIDTPNIFGSKDRYIIRDFKAESLFSERPYVKNWPYMRSYVEVPLVSSSGYTIGSYCVVDNKLRKDFEEESSITILNEVASVIMQHLELMRAAQNYSRTGRLLNGLSGFLEGSSYINEESYQGPLPKKTHEHNNGILPVDSKIPDNENENVSSQPDVFEAERDMSASEISSLFSTPTLATPMSSSGTSYGLESPPTGDREEYNRFENPTGTETQTTTQTHTTSIQQSLVSTGVREACSRASNLIRKSLDVEGVVFLDAYPRGYASSGATSSPMTVDMTEPYNLIGQEPGIDNNSPPCLLLGSSTVPNISLPKCSSTSGCIPLPESLLQRLIMRYPRGQILSADEFGPLLPRTTSDLFLAEGASGPEKSANQAFNKEVDVSTLLDLFDTPRSAIFLPLWDYQRERWFAGALVWSMDAERQFEKSDLTYLSAFGNSIMAELSRVDALATSRAKSDFISSISHDLRSPLHGILASAELVEEMIQPVPPVAADMLDIIVSCGRTLLDTMNHLLDFAKINRLTKVEAEKESKNGAQSESTSSKQPTSQAKLDLLVQDVVESVYLGHYSQKSPSTILKSQYHRSLDMEQAEPEGSAPRPTVTLHIENHQDWLVHINIGAWKRIVMNIFGNALKYTHAGQIQVSLRFISISTSLTQAQQGVCFEVIDTGVGMSSDYLKYHLFRPFSQENSHSVGTGLGLSIAHQIIQSMGGKLEVQSQLGIGTHVKVIVPIKGNEIELPHPAADSPLVSWGKIRKQFEGRVLCLVALNPQVPSTELRELGNKLKRPDPFHVTISRLASDWFGMNVVFADSIEAVDADFYLGDESYFESLQNYEPPVQSMAPVRAGALIAISDKISLGKVWTIGKRVVTSLQHPIGPKKLLSILVTALDSVQHIPILQPSPITSVDNTVIKNDDVVLNRTTVSTVVSTQEMVHTAVTEIATLTLSNPIPVNPIPEAQLRDPSQQHILIADDNSINLKILETHIRKLSHSYAIAMNGLEAVYTYKTSEVPFDVIFMDINMPVMDGFTATQEIRAYERAMQLPNCKVVALTGLASVTSQQEAFTSGIDLFLTKPVPLKAISGLLAQFREGKDVVEE